MAWVQNIACATELSSFRRLISPCGEEAVRRVRHELSLADGADARRCGPAPWYSTGFWPEHPESPCFSQILTEAKE